MEYRELIEKQRAYFASGATRGLESRLHALKELERALADLSDPADPADEEVAS